MVRRVGPVRGPLPELPPTPFSEQLRRAKPILFDDEAARILVQSIGGGGDVEKGKKRYSKLPLQAQCAQARREAAHCTIDDAEEHKHFVLAKRPVA